MTKAGRRFLFDSDDRKGWQYCNIDELKGAMDCVGKGYIKKMRLCDTGASTPDFEVKFTKKGRKKINEVRG